MKRILSVFMSFMLLLMLAPAIVSAAESGSFGADGDNLTWTLTGDTLTISGTGAMEDFRRTPWDRYAREITNVVIENGVTNIGNCAFEDFTSIETVQIAASVTSIGNYAFSYCMRLESITLSDGLLSIGDFAFSNCRLLEITLPDSLLSIGDFAFENCQFLETLTIPASVSSIKSSFLVGCRFLDPLIVAEENEYYCSVDGSLFSKDKTTIVHHVFDVRHLDPYTIPDCVTSIDSYAFSSSNIISVEIPSSVTYIGDNAFRSCIFLENIIVAEENQNYCSVDGNLFNKDKLTFIQYAAGKEETSYTVPESVTSIGSSAFYGSNLASIELPDSVTSIGDEAFARCQELKNINIPSSLTQINSCTFIYCYSLYSIVIPDGVTRICELAFGGCSRLKVLYIPLSIEMIEDSAFSGCERIEKIFYAGTAQQWNDIEYIYYHDELEYADIQYNAEEISGVYIMDCVGIINDDTYVGYTVTCMAASKTDDCILYAAVYGEDGILKGCGTGSGTGNTIDINIFCKVEYDDIIKAYLWSSGTMSPLYEPVTCEAYF